MYAIYATPASSFQRPPIERLHLREAVELIGDPKRHSQAPASSHRFGRKSTLPPPGRRPRRRRRKKSSARSFRRRSNASAIRRSSRPLQRLSITPLTHVEAWRIRALVYSNNIVCIFGHCRTDRARCARSGMWCGPGTAKAPAPVADNAEHRGLAGFHGATSTGHSSPHARVAVPPITQVGLFAVDRVYGIDSQEAGCSKFNRI